MSIIIHRVAAAASSLLLHPLSPSNAQFKESLYAVAQPSSERRPAPPTSCMKKEEIEVFPFSLCLFLLVVTLIALQSKKRKRRKAFANASRCSSCFCCYCFRGSGSDCTLSINRCCGSCSPVGSRAAKEQVRSFSLDRFFLYFFVAEISLSKKQKTCPNLDLLLFPPPPSTPLPRKAPPLRRPGGRFGLLRRPGDSLGLLRRRRRSTNRRVSAERRGRCEQRRGRRARAGTASASDAAERPAAAPVPRGVAGRGVDCGRGAVAGGARERRCRCRRRRTRRFPPREGADGALLGRRRRGRGSSGFVLLVVEV